MFTGDISDMWECILCIVIFIIYSWASHLNYHIQYVYNIKKHDNNRCFRHMLYVREYSVWTFFMMTIVITIYLH